ncbi:hypothetical protein [Luteimonas kalidii]|uniref:Glycosyltransferase RgtA/B/C/D-like domain-containing protein n=1 Tax=Luteimonas kalidii TaxID=3042025 RepID=A0ABT6JTH4_9GAMM|nr:hypothetical protein [Luteimonas kalidii]MDH5833989.1 hypothetical protein [Luteimonas kalidii]
MSRRCSAWLGKGAPVLLLQWLAMTALGIWLALWWQPAPHSDWGYYWSAAGTASAYERGGLSLWLLALPKALGWSPVASALALNLPAATVALVLAWRVDPTRWRILAHATAAYLLLITPFFGIVQLDLIAAAQLGIGAWLAAGRAKHGSQLLHVALAIVAVALAVSTRPQYALVLWVFVPLTGLLVAFRGRPASRALVVQGVLVAGSLLGFATDMAMRQASGRTEQIRTSSAVTLYAGLLVSSDRWSQRCGNWSPAAAAAAREDLDRPMLRAVADRLAARPGSHWASVIACKAPQIGSPPPYAMYWLFEAPNVRERIDARPDRDRIEAAYRALRRVENVAYRGVCLAILALCLMIAWWLLRRGNRLGWIPLAWVAGFWAVHMVFEVQGRYFLGLYLLAPLWCGLVLGAPPVSAARAGGKAGTTAPSEAAHTGS